MLLQKIVIPILFFITCNGFCQKDTLYTKYDAIFTSFNFKGISEFISFDYLTINDTAGNVIENSDVFYSSLGNSFGISINTKYYGFYFNVRPLNDYVAKKNYTTWDSLFSLPQRRNFGFNYFFKYLDFKAQYSMCKGGQNGNFSDFQKFRSTSININVEYCFNRKYRLGRINSNLFFPRKSLYSLSLKSNLYYNKLQNNGTAFLSTNTNTTGSTFLTTLNHVFLSEFSGIEFLTGFYGFITKNQFKRDGALKNFSWFFNPSVIVGPSFYNGKIKCIDSSYDIQKYGIRLNYQIKIRFGLNIKSFLFDSGIGLYSQFFKLNNYSQNYALGFFSLSIGYRIPFKKGYEKTDAFMKKINPFKKKKEETKAAESN